MALNQCSTVAWSLIIALSAYISVASGQGDQCVASRLNISGCEVLHIRQLSYKHFCSIGSINSKYSIFLKPDLGFRNTKVKFITSDWETGITFESDIKRESSDSKSNWNEVCLAQMINKNDNKHWILMDHQPREVKVLQTVTYNPSENITVDVFGSVFVSLACDPRVNSSELVTCSNSNSKYHNSARARSLSDHSESKMLSEKNIVLMSLFALLIGSNITLIIVVILYITMKKQKIEVVRYRCDHLPKSLTQTKLNQSFYNSNELHAEVHRTNANNDIPMKNIRNSCKIKLHPAGSDNLSDFEFVDASLEDLRSPEPP